MSTSLLPDAIGPIAWPPEDEPFRHSDVMLFAAQCNERSFTHVTPTGIHKLARAYLDLLNRCDDYRQAHNAITDGWLPSPKHLLEKP